MSTQTEILERVLKDLKYYQQYGAKVILETAIFDLEHVIKEPPASKPLTRERVREICEGSGYDKATMQERADFINGIRHAEAAHGIKEQP